MKTKPEYERAKAHLDNPSDQSLWPRTPEERRAVEVVKSQRRFTESRRRIAARIRANKKES